MKKILSINLIKSGSEFKSQSYYASSEYILCLYVSMFPQFKIYETLNSNGNKNSLTKNPYYHTVDPLGAIFMRRFYDSKFLQSEY